MEKAVALTTDAQLTRLNLHSVSHPDQQLVTDDEDFGARMNELITLLLRSLTSQHG